MGIIDRFEEEYLDVSSSHASVRELLELLVGAVLFVVGASALAYLSARSANQRCGSREDSSSSLRSRWSHRPTGRAVTGREDYEE